MTQRNFSPTPEVLGPASLLRRIAAMAYDSLLVIALLMITTGVYMMASSKILGAERYQAITAAGSTIGDPLLSLILLMTLYLFFGFFWTKNGQTLGMQVWRIRIQNPDHTSISWMQSMLRLIGSIAAMLAFGTGYLWILADKKKRSWPCLLSKTEVVRIAKNPQSK